MAVDRSVTKQTSFADATAVTRTSSHTYTANFPDDWCIGSVPHGGFVTSVFMRVASLHFSTTLASCKQPHTIALHLDFLRRTATGRATFTVVDKKLGRQTSVIHVSLAQGPAHKPREEVVGYLTQSNMATETGPSFPSDWALHPPPQPVDIAALARDADAHWCERKFVPFPAFRKASLQVRSFFPRGGFGVLGVTDTADEWVSFATVRPGERFCNEALGFIADMWPQVIEIRNNDEVYDARAEEYARRVKREGAPAAKYWYPTLLLNLDVKKVLPPEGVEWLFARVRAKQIRNGRYDLEVVILDEGGDIVALSHHVTMAVPAARNLSKRRDAPDDAKL